ncbi:MAG: outer membrane protein assembly factor BamD [Bacteroidota bacterium]
MKTISLMLITTVILFTSCSNYQRVLKGSDMNLKFETAEKYYQKEEYYRALQLLEELMVVYRGTEKGEKVYYYYAYCNYHIGDFVMASYHFNNFLLTYPNSTYSEEVQFQYAYCYYLDSPVPSLDQTSSIDAIDKFQLFVNRYPKSEKVEQANNLIDELRLKLEIKAFNNAKLYYKTENYKAAITALQNVVVQFPAAIFKEEIYYLVFRSSYLYAINSVDSKLLQRLKDARENYLRLVDAFPQSKYLQDAERAYNNVTEELKKRDPVSLNN